MPTWRSYVLALAAVLTLTAGAVLLRAKLNVSSFALVYTLLVLVVAVRLGTRPALLSAFASFIAINFFLIHPFYSLTVADSREVLELLVFLLVAGTVGQLGAQARHQTHEAHRRAHEQALLYRLARSFNQLTHRAGVYAALTAALHHDLSAQQADILPHQPPQSLSGAPVYYLLLQGSAAIYGTVRVVFPAPLTASQSQLVNACVAQAAMALERIDLAEKAIKAHQFEEADKLKTAILQAVSHDLRTPITIIKTSAANLRQLGDQLPPAQQREIAHTIEQETDRLDKLVGNLLDLSRLQAGALALNSGPNALEEIAGDVAALFWQRTHQERLTLCFPDEMPPVDFDYGLLLQAVTNIVENSLRYEVPARQVELRGEIHPAELWLKVINHGQSIAPATKAHIMEPFYRGSQGHIGLGLPIAKGIVEAHHGRLWVEDTPGGGATFVLALPRQRQEDL